MSVRIDPETGELTEDGNVRASGGSVVVTLPQDIARQARLSPGDSVEFAVNIEEEGRIEIREKGNGGEGGDNV